MLWCEMNSCETWTMNRKALKNLIGSGDVVSEENTHNNKGGQKDE